MRSIGAVRERCNVVKEKAFKNELNHFDVDMSKFDDTASFVVGLIKVRMLTLTLILLAFTFGEKPDPVLQNVPFLRRK